MRPHRASLALLISLFALLVPAASAAPLSAEPPALRLVGHYGGAMSAVALSMARCRAAPPQPSACTCRWRGALLDPLVEQTVIRATGPRSSPRQSGVVA
jgi:hypothetical protein